MKLTPTTLPSVFIIEEPFFPDERGYFQRLYCRRDLAGQGIDFDSVQSSVSFNRQQSTLRGMHYQAAPHSEKKLVTCLWGAIWDVALDLRPGSPAFGKWFALELKPGSGRSLYIPEGCAHGFLTLEDNSVVGYQISQYYHPTAAQGVRWDDPRFGIAWPQAPQVISDRDRSYPDYPGES